MAVFSSSRNAAAPAEAAGTVALSILAPGVRVVGEIDSEGIVKIEGRMTGNVKSRQDVLVVKGGTVEGDIEAATVVIAGRVTGNIAARHRLEIQAGGAVHGDVKAPKVVILEGGEVNGRIAMGKAPEPRRLPSPVAA